MTKQTEALRMAIEAIDWELGSEPLPTLMIEARKACKEALAETQEPMIIKQENGMVLKLGYDELPNGTAFYTTPPSRQWVGLSDEEYIDMLVKANKPMKSAPDMAIEFGRAIDTALREINNGA